MDISYLRRFIKRRRRAKMTPFSFPRDRLNFFEDSQYLRVFNATIPFAKVGFFI